MLVFNVVHRDVKPENFLVKEPTQPSPDQQQQYESVTPWSQLTLKLIDFGSAKEFTEGGQSGNMTDYIGTRWYRAPELILGSRQYDQSIDVFAVGCLMGELYLGRPLFPGQNAQDQLLKQVSIIGAPTQDEWPQGYKLCEQSGMHFPHMSTTPLTSLIKSSECSQNGFELLNSMLSFDPRKRITAQAALSHAYLRDVQQALSGIATSQPSQRIPRIPMNRIQLNQQPQKSQFNYNQPGANVDLNADLNSQQRSSSDTGGILQSKTVVNKGMISSNSKDDFISTSIGQSTVANGFQGGGSGQQLPQQNQPANFQSEFDYDQGHNRSRLGEYGQQAQPTNAGQREGQSFIGKTGYTISKGPALLVSQINKGGKATIPQIANNSQGAGGQTQIGQQPFNAQSQYYTPQRETTYNKKFLNLGSQLMGSAGTLPQNIEPTQSSGGGNLASNPFGGSNTGMGQSFYNNNSNLNQQMPSVAQIQARPQQADNTRQQQAAGSSIVAGGGFNSRVANNQRRAFIPDYANNNQSALPKPGNAYAGIPSIASGGVAGNNAFSMYGSGGGGVELPSLTNSIAAASEIPRITHSRSQNQRQIPYGGSNPMPSGNQGGGGGGSIFSGMASKQIMGSNQHGMPHSQQPPLLGASTDFPSLTGFGRHQS